LAQDTAFSVNDVCKVLNIDRRLASLYLIEINKFGLTVKLAFKGMHPIYTNITEEESQDFIKKAFDLFKIDYPEFSRDLKKYYKLKPGLKAPEIVGALSDISDSMVNELPAMINRYKDLRKIEIKKSQVNKAHRKLNSGGNITIEDYWKILG